MRKSGLAIASMLFLCLVSLTALASKLLNVQIRDAQLRENPSFLAKVVAQAEYGQGVDVLEEKGDWSRVSLGGTQGWLHSSALTSQRLGVSGKGAEAQTGASGKEMALAGKGFNAQVESDYRRSHGADYAAVDRMERVSYPPAQLVAFLTDAGVKPQGGQ